MCLWKRSSSWREEKTMPEPAVRHRWPGGTGLLLIAASVVPEEELHRRS